MRDHDVSGQTADQLVRARRELAASLALVRPDSPARVPILAHLSAIDTELATRTGQLTMGAGPAGWHTAARARPCPPSRSEPARAPDHDQSR